jgi:glutamate dehydrogenase/leucine dehydrogenase
LETKIHYLGQISVLGTNDQAEVMRYHCGPEGTIKRGGTKFKEYQTVDLQITDGIHHARAMAHKLGATGEVDYSGGKTSVNFNPRTHSEEQGADAMRQVANLMNDAGLADPFVDGTAGDEGTNGHIVHYVYALRDRGVPHPEACITGKPNMATRPGATGRGGAMNWREHMRLEGSDKVTAIIQGAGAAGLYFAAEAYDPIHPEDGQLRITPKALGDLDPVTKRPIALVTDSPDGLPITQDMADAIVQFGDHDRDMQTASGSKLHALARKLERQHGEGTVDLRTGDVLTYDLDVGPDTYLVPAATSDVLTPRNIEDITIRKWFEMGNHTVHEDLLPLLPDLGVVYLTGEEKNAGGTFMSTEENRRDLARIKAAETGVPTPQVSDEEYNLRLLVRMRQNARRVHQVGNALGIPQSEATRVVALGNYAMARGMQIDPQVRELLLAV